MSSLLPIFLDLKDKNVLLVGGGLAALEKLEKLLVTGAKLRVVAEHFHPKTLDLLNQHKTQWEQRSFREDDLNGLFLVISAVQNASLHADIAQLSRQRSILINTVDAPRSTDFYFGAQVQRGPVQIAISTHGLFPGVARALRLWLEEYLPSEITNEFQDLVVLRKQVSEHIPDPVARMRALKEQLHTWLHQSWTSPRGETP